jgi:DNA-binding beta-propeller fold protein YncE
MSVDGVPANDVPVQLAFEIVNSAGGDTAENVIFVTSDAGYNKLSLQIALTSGTTTLAPGAIPDPSTPPGAGAGTTLYVDLSGLQMTVEAWSQMSLQANGWTFTKFSEEGIVGMTPVGAPVQLSAGTKGAISIGISGLFLTSAPKDPHVQVYAAYYNVPGVTGQYSTFAVAIRNASTQQSDLSEAIAVSLSANGIVNSIDPLLHAANAFSLLFSSRQRLVTAGPNTTFAISFVYGAPRDQYGYGALSDAPRAAQIAVTQGENAEDWQITPNINTDSPNWTLQPPDGAAIVGSGVQSVVGIDFSNVITAYQPGPTVMLISYSQVPGYRDGTFTVVLNKVAHAAIGSLQVSPNPTYFVSGSAAVTVSWSVSGAQSLELTQNYQTTPVTGRTQLPATLEAELTTFTLKATGTPGTVENSDYRTVQAIALPVINSFSGSPTEIYSGSTSHDASFNWVVDSSDDVTLSSTGDAFDGQSFGPKGSASVPITQPQMVTLAPVTAANPLALTRRLVISAFEPTPESHSLPFTPTAVIASPTGPFVVVAGPASSLTALDTVQYATAGSVDLGHAPSALTFSPDGATLVSANSDATVSVIDVTLGPTGLPVFGSPSTIPLDGAPQAVVFSPHGPRIFVTVDPGGATAGHVVSLLHSGAGYAVEGTVTVGHKPRALTLDAAGTRLFVANSAEDTVTVVGLTAGGALGGTTTIHGLTGQPTGVAATPDGRQLLVSCLAGTVVAIDPDHPDKGQRSVLTVGRSPGQISLTPSGAYAAVANRDDGSVSLIDCWGLPRSSRVVGQPLSVGSQPVAIAATPDGLQLLVAVAGGLSVITLAIYRAVAEAPSVPNGPTSVAVSTDGANLFAWHDAQLPARSQSPGILVYNQVSRTVSNLLASQNVLRCVVSPDPLAKQAFAIVQGDAGLHLIATDTLETDRQDLGLAPGTTPVALAVCGEGQTLFVAVADASHNLSLVVLRWQDTTWAKAQTVALYRQVSPGRILLRPTPDATSLFLVDVAAAQVRVLRLTGASYTLSPTTIAGDVRALDLALVPDGSAAYVLNAGQATNTVTIVDVASLQSHVAAIPQSYVNLTALQPSPDGRWLFAVDTDAAAVRILDPRSLRILQTILLSSSSGSVAGAAGLAVMPDGSRLFTANILSQTLSIVEQIQMGIGGQPSLRPRSAFGANDVYTGLFMRHYLGETPSSPPDGWSASPDVIPYGRNIALDEKVFTEPTGYGTDYGATVYLQNPNYVYVRGLNPGPAQITSRVYFYYTRASLLMWPANWREDNITVNKVPQNWVDVTAAANGGVGVGQSPMLWTPPALDPGSDHYCVIAWVSDGPNPQPPNFASYSQFATGDDLVQFVLSHHNMAWRNTSDILTPPPDYSYNCSLPMGPGGGSVYLAVSFQNIPSDGTFAVNVQGPDQANSVSLPPSPLSQYQGGFSPRNNPLNFPANFTTSVQVQHWPGPTPLPPNAKINVSLLVQIAPSLARDIERQFRPAGLRTPLRRFGKIPVALVGLVQYRLLFGGQRSGAGAVAPAPGRAVHHPVGVAAPRPAPSPPAPWPAPTPAPAVERSLKLGASTGIVIRQAMDSSSPIFTNSPDLILTGTTPSFDPDAFTDPDAYDWYFSQSPVIGSANYLYVRGVNYTPTGAQQARVYLYYAQSDKLLDPSTWQSSGFTVGGAPQNYMPLSAVSLYQHVVTSPPMVWIPPQPSPNGASYFLISWIDNSANPAPPTWPTTPFADMAALGAYIKAHPAMALLDTVYKGAFMRQFPGQSVGQDGTGAQTSPDIIVTGTGAARDASQFATQGSYSPGTLSADAALDARNFVYVRALNTTGKPARARIYMYWATSANISPSSWNTTNFKVAGQTQNWVDLVAGAANEVMISTVPLVWFAPAPGETYILIAYVENSENPQPPDFTAFGFINPQAVTAFVASHPQLAWLALNGKPIPPATMSSETPLIAGTGANSLYVGVQLTNIPTDGTLSLSVPGPDAADTLVIQSLRIPDANALVAWPVTYPDHFQTSAVITYSAGATPVGAGKIVATMLPRPAR